jgi:hypothetical protein
MCVASLGKRLYRSHAAAAGMGVSAEAAEAPDRAAGAAHIAAETGYMAAMPEETAPMPGGTVDKAGVQIADKSAAFVGPRALRQGPAHC